MNDALALARVDGCHAVAMCWAGPVAHFNEDQRVMVLHDEVDLAAPRVEVARQRAQPMACKILLGERFGPASGLL